MTNEEALSLAKDQRVEVKLKDRWVAARVIKLKLVTQAPAVVVLTLRREEPSESGYRPHYRKYPGDVRFPPDHAAANVYAGFLEEHGEARAAALLRREFPLNA